MRQDAFAAALPRQPRRAAGTKCWLRRRSCWTACCSAPSAKTAALLPAETSARPSSTATPTTRARSGTTSAGCSRRSTRATRPWASTPTTAGCSPTIRSWTACRCRTRSAPTSATWAITTTARPTRRRPTPRPAGNSSLIDVDILGHIFEQSITDLERLRNELDGLRRTGRATEKHKTPAQEGRRVLHPGLHHPLHRRAGAGRRAARPLRATPRSRTRRRPRARPAAALADPDVYDLDTLKKPAARGPGPLLGGLAGRTGGLRLLDPACGSGAFLIEAFDQLHAAYQASNARLEELRGHRTLFDLDQRILENNLYGVDLNEEAIEICRLSLWIKTAERGKVLTSLDHTIRVGNSIVGDPAVHPKAFDWQAAFPEVFAAGRLRRRRRQPALRPAGVAQPDQAVSGIGLPRLPRHGRPLRLLLRTGPAAAEAGRAAVLHRHEQVDEGRLRRAAAPVLSARTPGSSRWWTSGTPSRSSRKPTSSRRSSSPDARPTPPSPTTARLCTIPREQLRIDDLSRQIEQEGVELPLSQLGADAWQLEPAGVTGSGQIKAQGRPLAEYRSEAVSRLVPATTTPF